MSYYPCCRTNRGRMNRVPLYTPFLIMTATKKLFLQTIEETKGIYFEIWIWGVIS